MPYAANVVQVMIASPGDVAEERQVIREVIAEWNAIHSKSQGTVLMPISWDTHASPTMSGRPQDIINKRVLKDCDLLVAVFWTRIGSSTGVAISGTVEEIEEHLAEGKEAMIYFSQQPVRLDSVDEEQYKAVREFKKNCKERGLVEEYEALSEFRTKFTRQLTQTILSGGYGCGTGATIDEAEAGAAETTASRDLPDLNDSARTLLLEAAQDRSGVIMKVACIGSFSIQTNGKQFVEPGNPRSRVAWESAIESLCNEGLVDERGYKGEVFHVTNEGYRVADLLRLES
ncbi:MAG: DUF4062 domain-containing protein [Phycisphaerales bacterium]|nr:DUF4062 domain-containing protein [Phycisphaerales bacterium]